MIIIFSGGAIPCTADTAQLRVLKFCKKYYFLWSLQYNLNNFHWDLRMGCELWLYIMEWPISNKQTKLL